MLWFQAGGVGMYLILASAALIGLGSGLALVVAVVGWFYRPLRVLARIGGALAIAACVLPMAIGVGASAMGRSTVRQALEHVDDPEMRDVILARGNQEASIPTVFGGGMSCVLLMPAVLAALVALAIPAPRDED